MRAASGFWFEALIDVFSADRPGPGRLCAGSPRNEKVNRAVSGATRQGDAKSRHGNGCEPESQLRLQGDLL